MAKAQNLKETLEQKLDVLEDQAERIEDRVEDAAESLGAQLKAFYERNRVAVLAGAGVLVLAGGVIAFLLINGASRNEKASEEMFMALRAFEKDSLNLALNGTETFTGLDGITDEYSGTKPANIAQYAKGVALIDKGDLDAGIEALQSMSKGDNLLSWAAYMKLGFAHEEKGDFARAASNFEQAATTVADNDETTPTALNYLGLAYLHAEEYAKAAETFKRLKGRFPTSSEAYQADKYIGYASAKAGL